MKNSYLEGRRFIKLIRCSQDEQADTSPEDQSKVMGEYGVKNGMIHVDRDVKLEGVSASHPASRTDIDRVIGLKRLHEDFDVLLMQDFSRLTRGGIDHAGSIKWDLAKAGIEVVFVTFSSSGDADQDSLIQSIGFYGAQQWAKSNSYACVRGQMSSMQAGNLPHTFRIPFGIDRMYVGPDGKYRHRIRNMTDGTQQKLDPDKDVVLAVFAKNPKKGARMHYHRQSDEKVLLIPGAPEAVDVVRRIYLMKLLEGKGSYLTALALNNEGIPSPTGKKWNTDTIESILHNPTYTGVGIAERYATGVYHVRGKAATPQSVHRSIITAAQRKKSTVAFRPREEWRWQPHPLLVNYLDEQIRTLANAMQAEVFDVQAEKAIAPKKAAKPGGDRHGDSPYLLKELLRSKQGDHPMSGALSGPNHDRRRYYRVSRGISMPQQGSVFSKMLAAEPLERAVLAVIKQVLLDVPNLRQHVERAVASQLKATSAGLEQATPLLAERDVIQAHLEDALTLGPASRRLMQAKLDQWENRLIALELRIAECQTTKAMPTVDVDAVVAATAARFAATANALETLPPAAVRTFLKSIIARIEIDLETRGLEMDLVVPAATALRKPKKNEGDDGQLCLVPPKHSPYPNETQWLNGLKIAFVTCEGQRGGRVTTPCFTCSRQAA